MPGTEECNNDEEQGDENEPQRMAVQIHSAMKMKPDRQTLALSSSPHYRIPSQEN